MFAAPPPKKRKPEDLELGSASAKPYLVIDHLKDFCNGYDANPGSRYNVLLDAVADYGGLKGGFIAWRKVSQQVMPWKIWDGDSAQADKFSVPSNGTRVAMMSGWSAAETQLLTEKLTSMAVWRYNRTAGRVSSAGCTGKPFGRRDVCGACADLLVLEGFKTALRDVS